MNPGLYTESALFSDPWICSENQQTVIQEAKTRSRRTVRSPWEISPIEISWPPLSTRRLLSTYPSCNGRWLALLIFVGTGAGRNRTGSAAEEVSHG